MAGVVLRRRLTANIKEVMEAATGRAFGVVRSPGRDGDETIHAEEPYGIIYPLDPSGYSGSYFHHPDSDADLQYQFTYVGLRDDQVEWLADLSREAILGRDSSGQFNQAFTSSDLVVMSREPVGSPGSITKTDAVYSMTDTFVFRCTASTSAGPSA